MNEEGFAHRGRIDFFDNQVNAQSGTIRLRAVFDNEDRALLPGMFANVRVLAGPPEQTLLVPDVAVGSDQGYRYVYVVNAEDIVAEAGHHNGPGARPAARRGQGPDAGGSGGRQWPDDVAARREGCSPDSRVQSPEREGRRVNR